MRQIEPGGYAPHGYRLRDVPWGGNGWWSADGDVLGAALGLEKALDGCATNEFQIQKMLDQYSYDLQRLEVLKCLGHL